MARAMVDSAHRIVIEEAMTAAINNTAVEIVIATAIRAAEGAVAAEVVTASEVVGVAMVAVDTVIKDATKDATKVAIRIAAADIRIRTKTIRSSRGRVANRLLPAPMRRFCPQFRRVRSRSRKASSS